MSPVVSIQTLTVFKRPVLWLAAGVLALVLVGAVGRDPACGQAPEVGYSVVDMSAAGESGAEAGCVPIRMHQLRVQPSPLVKDVEDDGLDLGRSGNAIRFNNTSPDSVQPIVVMPEQPLEVRGKAKGKDKDDLFASLKSNDEKASDKDRLEETDDLESWGWLAEGVKEREQAEVQSLEEKMPSSTDVYLKSDLLPGDTIGTFEPTESVGSGKTFSWQAGGTEPAP